jgi:hypothetical protein
MHRSQADASTATALVQSALIQSTVVQVALSAWRWSQLLGLTLVEVGYQLLDAVQLPVVLLRAGRRSSG